MEPVGPDGHIGPFSRSNDSRAGKSPHFANFSSAISQEFLVIRNSNVIFVKKFQGRPLSP
ncbi:hypothetical protein H5410_042194 [Solanum commersonii]|uniref:Uncharacterized protein n=1 Tax=Solanum commersonii TaxID=4109 RepID=A0A9J5XWT7_SOLCO|nr:hypothetical protein H5410_042194 [Solanum commersonii]